MYASYLLSLAALASSVIAVPDIYKFHYSSDNIVSINGLDNLCVIAPKNPHTDIGVAEGSGTKTYCSDKARYDPANQGRLPTNFFQPGQAAFTVSGSQGRQIRQITGCINTSQLSRLNPSDQGGQFDSSGQGNDGVPSQSFCILPGKNQRGFYVQQFEPAENRFCIRCCENNADCDHTHDTAGCEVAIPGWYGPNCR
jgi:hypothetical protein